MEGVKGLIASGSTSGLCTGVVVGRGDGMAVADCVGCGCGFDWAEFTQRYVAPARARMQIRLGMIRVRTGYPIQKVAVI